MTLLEDYGEKKIIKEVENVWNWVTQFQFDNS
jgi:hypothetical protein